MTTKFEEWFSQDGHIVKFDIEIKRELTKEEFVAMNESIRDILDIVKKGLKDKSDK